MEILIPIIFFAILAGLIALIVWSVIHPLPCLISKILLNAIRVVLAIIILCNSDSILIDETGGKYIGYVIVFAIITGLLFLYGLGGSIYVDTVHETGNIVLEPLQNGYRFVSEKAGDTKIGNLITALFFTAIACGIAFLFWLIVICLALENMKVLFFIIVLVLTAINVFRSIKRYCNEY